MSFHAFHSYRRLWPRARVAASLALALAALSFAPATAQTTDPTKPWRMKPSDGRQVDPGDGRPPRFYRMPGGSAGAPGRPDKTARKPAATPAEQLDQLYGRLAKARDEAEAQGVTRRIERLLGRSSSDTANLLMTRAIVAAAHDEMLLAEDLLDRILELEPNWAEAWARRAAIRTARDDISGGVADFGRALAIEPRHVGALGGLGLLLLRVERKDEALRVLNKALDVNPYLQPAKKIVVKLTAERGGRDL